MKLLEVDDKLNLKVRQKLFLNYLLINLENIFSRK
jgi:hypothetical protein